MIMDACVEAIDFGQQTTELFVRILESPLLQTMLVSGWTEQRAIMHMTDEAVRNSHLSREHVAMWHRSVRYECSELYDHLRGEVPDDPFTTDLKRDVNQNPDLQRLNAVRLGLRMVMKRNHQQAA